MCVVRLLAEISTVGARFYKTRTTVPHSIWHFRSEKGYAIFHCYEYHLDSLIKVHTLKTLATALCAAKLFSIFFSSASRGTAWPLDTKFVSYAYELPSKTVPRSHVLLLSFRNKTLESLTSYPGFLTPAFAVCTTYKHS